MRNKDMRELMVKANTQDAAAWQLLTSLPATLYYQIRENSWTAAFVDFKNARTIYADESCPRRAVVLLAAEVGNLLEEEIQ